MKKRRKLLCVIMTVILLFGTLTVDVSAAGLAPGVETGAASSVIQSGSKDTFTENMPFANYRVYPSYLEVGGSYMDSCTIKTGSNLVREDYFYEIFDMEETDIPPQRNAIIYTGDIAPGQTVFINGDAVVFVYKGAAVDYTGGYHDVKITFSDITIKNCSTGVKAKTAKATVLILGSIWCYASMFDSSELSPETAAKEVREHYIKNCAVDMTVTLEIQNTTFGGTFAAKFNDIDQPDRQGADDYTGEYSERIILKTAPKSMAYITETGNTINVSKDSSGNLIFRGTASDPNATFNSGFAVQMDTTNTLQWRGGACGTGLYGASFNLGIRPVYKKYNSNGTIDSNYTIGTAGGDISMTESYDNSKIVYSAQDVLYNKNYKYALRFYSHYKPVTIEVSPAAGYKLVDLNTTNSFSATSFTGTSLKSKLSGNAYSFTTSNANEYYQALYEPITSSIKIIKKDQDGSPMKDVVFTASGTSSALGAFSISGKTDENGELVLNGIPYGTGSDKYTLTETVPEGYRSETPADNSVAFYYSENQLTFDFVNMAQHKVSYTAQPDSVWGSPAGSAAPQDETVYDHGATVTVKPVMSTNETTACKSGSTDPIPGTWSFSKNWETTDATVSNGEFTITKDTSFTGQWVFTPDTYKVDYSWSGDVPENLTAPEDDPDYGWHDMPDVNKDYTDQTTIAGTKNGVPGEYKFSGWTTSDPDLTDAGMEGDVTYVGTWTFTPYTYTVNYQTKEDDTWGKPKDENLPSDTKAYDYQDEVTVAGDLSSTQGYAIDKATGKQVPGSWSFTSWTTEEAEISDGKFVITQTTTLEGKWSFTPDSYKVNYSWEGDVPDDVTLPEDNDPYKWHDVPTADPAYDENTVIPGTKDGVPGEYKFSGWDASEDPDLTPDGMEGSVTFTGTWTFVPDEITPPATGYSTHLELWLCLMCISLLGMAVLLIQCKKEVF